MLYTIDRLTITHEQTLVTIFMGDCRARLRDVGPTGELEQVVACRNESSRLQ